MQKAHHICLKVELPIHLQFHRCIYEGCGNQSSLKAIGSPKRSSQPPLSAPRLVVELITLDVPMLWSLIMIYLYLSPLRAYSSTSECSESTYIRFVREYLEPNAISYTNTHYTPLLRANTAAILVLMYVLRSFISSKWYR